MSKKKIDNMTVEELKKSTTTTKKKAAAPKKQPVPPTIKGINPKYDFTGEYIKVGGKTLWEIRLIRPLNTSAHPYLHSAGVVGGYIESEENLSHEGNCWISDDCSVWGKSVVKDNAYIEDGSTISNDCVVGGNVYVSGSTLSNNVRARGDAMIESSTINMDVEICGTFTIIRGCNITGSCNINAEEIEETRIVSPRGRRICIEDAGVNIYKGVICHPDDIFYIPNVGSRQDTVTFFRADKAVIKVYTGCFCDTLEKFIAAVAKTHGSSNAESSFYYDQYQHCIALAKSVMNRSDILQEN